MDESEDPLGPYDFPELLSAFATLLDRHNAAIIGGQALNIWATYFYEQAEKELVKYAPYTSKDIDYYGSRRAAEALANALGGDVLIPGPDDQTPNTAVAIVDLAGRRRMIDFLEVLAGVPHRIIRGRLATVDLDWPISDEADAYIRTLHPLPVLMSRAGNIVTLRRKDRRSIRQMQASIIILGEYFQERLNMVVNRGATNAERDDAHREAVDMAKALLEWVSRDQTARGVYEQGHGDPLAALDAVVDHPGWDDRFLARELRPRLERVRVRRRRCLVEANRKRERSPT